MNCFASRLLIVVFAITMLCGNAFAAAPVDLVLWVNSWPQEAVAAIQRVADIFAERNPAVNSVTVQPIVQAELVEKLTLGVVADAAPDVVTLPAPFVQYQMNGLIQPIDAWFAKSTQVRRQDYPPELMQSFAVSGKQYGIPAIEVGPGLLLFYSVDLFNEAGLPDAGPQSLDELLQMHKKLTREDPNTGKLTRVGIHPMDSMGGTYFPDVWSTVFAAKWFDAASGQLDLLAFEPAVDYIKQIYDTHSYSLISGAGIGGWTNGLTKGQLGMQINGYWVPGELKSKNSPWQYKHTWMPSSLGDKATAALPWGMGIPANAKYPELSFQLIEFFSGPEAAQIIFDAVGWLNGNLPAMRRLNLRDLPVVAQIVSMFETASRFTAPAPVPIMEAIRNTMKNDLTSVWRGDRSARAALEDLQLKLQLQLDEIRKQK